MLPRDTIQQIPVDTPTVFAFRIQGEIDSEDMKFMASTMDSAFDRFDGVSMILIFDAYEGQELGAALNLEVLKSQFRALTNVDKYAVVGAPSAAATFIDLMDKVIPVDARTFDRDDEETAWEFVGARPLDGG